MYTDLTNICAAPDITIHQAISQMEISRIGVVLIVDAEHRLLGTITDGDIRRAVLANTDLDQPVSAVLPLKETSPSAGPITAGMGADEGILIGLFREHRIRHLPLVDVENRVVALVTPEEFISEQRTLPQAVVMTGGMGTRLSPLTIETPKSMLPIGDRPLLEIIVQQLHEAGIQQVNLSVHHKSEKITEHFGDGSNFGVDINYVTEDLPLGTAGGLGLMEKPKDTLLVMNGDILTQVNFHDMLAYHRENNADLTLAVQQYTVQLPYGVVECDGPVVRNLTEKPETNFLVNAGMYLLEPVVHGFIPKGEQCDMTELIQRVLDDGLTVVAFPLREYWVDIGEHADYEKANRDVEMGKIGS
jgi:dTDP-glucose pyrophosphorylase